ncbi:STAS domain-containing protein [Sorangium sp. So ce854]|uniref:STAS domain-containing protein n=1 Tax=Sorangium sp. So ce854 TaxID=3133322 RepID=UPI003F634A7D
MRDPSRPKNRRILLIDDNEAIHEDFRRILRCDAEPSDFERLDAALFRGRAGRSPVRFELTSATRGEEGLEKVREAREGGNPYALAFVDARMPPGWDGIETLSRIWREDSAIQAVICSAYADFSWGEISARFGHTDNLLILAKPFDPIEVRQMAFALTEKWNQRRALAEANDKVSAQYTVTRILVEATTLTEGVLSLLGALGETLGFRFAALWLGDDEGGGLRCEHTWSAAPDDAAELVAATRGARFARDAGLPGRALAQGEPSWFVDLDAVDDDARARAARGAGLRFAVELPIAVRADAQVAAVLELMDAAPRAHDPGLLDVLLAVAAKAGHFIGSKRVEAALRRSEANNRALLDAIPDTILRISSDGICLGFKASRESRPTLRAEDFLHRHVADVFPARVAEQITERVALALTDEATHVFEYQEQQGDGAREYEVRIAGRDEAEAVVIVRDITERKRAEAEAEARRAREDALRAQNETLAALSTPLIPISDDIVVMPLVGALDAQRVRRVQETLVRGVASRRAHVAILDITGVPQIDGRCADELLRAAVAVRLLGSEVILTGLGPDVARTLVELGVDMSGIVTHSTLQDGIASAMTASAARGKRRRRRARARR